MPDDIIIWSTTAHCWRTVRRAEAHGPIHFEPLAEDMGGELARRALVSAMRFARPLPGEVRGPAAWQPAAGDWED